MTVTWTLPSNDGLNDPFGRYRAGASRPDDDTHWLADLQQQPGLRHGGQHVTDPSVRLTLLYATHAFSAAPNVASRIAARTSRIRRVMVATLWMVIRVVARGSPARSR